MIATVMGVSEGELVDVRLEKLGWQIKLLAAQGRARPLFCRSCSCAGQGELLSFLYTWGWGGRERPSLLKNSSVESTAHGSLSLLKL